MSSIIIPGEKGPQQKGKDCADFVPLDDGTRMGDYKYCNRSFECRQIGMKSDYVEITDVKTGKVQSGDYLCQGLYFRKGEMAPDEEAS